MTVAGLTISNSWWRFFYTVVVYQLLQIVNYSREDVDYLTTHWLTSLQTLKNGGDNDNDVFHQLLSHHLLTTRNDNNDNDYTDDGVAPFVVCHLPGTHRTFSFFLSRVHTHTNVQTHTHALTYTCKHIYKHTHTHKHLHLQTTHCQTHTQTYPPKT